MEFREWKTIFMEGFPGYFKQIDRLERDLKAMHPRIYQKIKDCEANFSMAEVSINM
jgi:hypothetical protein